MLVFIWKVEDSAFEGWGEDQWEPEDFNPALKLSAGGRYVSIPFIPPISRMLIYIYISTVKLDR